MNLESFIGKMVVFPGAKRGERWFFLGLGIMATSGDVPEALASESCAIVFNAVKGRFLMVSIEKMMIAPEEHPDSCPVSV